MDREGEWRGVVALVCFILAVILLAVAAFTSAWQL